jgi:hypoxanthine phosphoribosyltransferase
MSSIQVLDKTFVPFIAETTIQQKVKEMAATLSHEYEGKKPLFIGILNGSFMFAADLFRHISIDAEISFIKLASYKGTKSTGTVITSIGLDVDISNRHIVIVEDIVDTGKTLHEFLPQLHNQQPASLKIAVLLHKPSAQQFPLTIDYTCFTIPNKFVLGYGLDYDGYGRNIKEIYQLSE